MNWPRYVCAILEDAAGQLLIEVRPGDARHAAGRMTCFGGEREATEDPELGLRRELREELAWEPGTLTKQVELWVAGQPIAWFYHASLDVAFDQLRFEPGYSALLVSRDELVNLSLSPWHAAVLNTWLAGGTRVEMEV